MVFKMYKKAFAVLLKKPFRLWGISLLEGLLTFLAGVLFGLVPGIQLAIGILLSTSMTMIYLHGIEGDRIETFQLFDCFKDWKTIKHVLCGMGWMKLWIIIWALIPFAGPIIAVIKAYSYRFVPYILVREPNVAIKDALKESEKRTNGYKGKMFGADILVIGAFIVADGVLSVFAQIPFIGGFFMFILVLLCICFFIFRPFFLGLVRASFYKAIEAKGRVVQQMPDLSYPTEH